MSLDSGDPFKVIVTVSVAREGDEIPFVMPGSLPVFLIAVDSQRIGQMVKFSGASVRAQAHPSAFDLIAKQVLRDICPEAIDRRPEEAVAPYKLDA